MLQSIISLLLAQQSYGKTTLILGVESQYFKAASQFWLWLAACWLLSSRLAWRQIFPGTSPWTFLVWLLAQALSAGPSCICWRNENCIHCLTLSSRTLRLKNSLLRVTISCLSQSGWRSLVRQSSMSTPQFCWEPYRSQTSTLRVLPSAAVPLILEHIRPCTFDHYV